MEVDYTKYQQMDFACKCGWHGKGKELVNGEFSEVHLIGDLSCPKCYEQIAFWQWPMKKEKKPRRK